MTSKPRILLVDSDGQHAHHIKTMLSSQINICHTTSTAKQAISMCYEQDIDILITSIDLPDMDGISLIQTCKQCRFNLQCIVIAPEFEIETVISAMQAGATDFLKIPISEERLLQSLQLCMDKRKQFNDRQIKILLVDDSPVALRVGSEMLNELGYFNIVKAVDGEMAIIKCQENQDIGLIISDWNMPKKTGLEFLEWLRFKADILTTPFIMATAEGEKSQILKAAMAGANQFLIKPFGLQDLQNVLEETLKWKDPSLMQRSNNSANTSPKKINGKVVLRTGYVPITDHLVLGMLNHQIETKQVVPKHFKLSTRRMVFWYSMQKALEKEDLDAVFILAPIAMDLFGFGMPIKLTLFAHKNGSICIKNNQLTVSDTSDNPAYDFFKNRTFYLPHQLSIHHMLSHMFFRELGLHAGFAGKKEVDVIYEVIPPIRMPDLQAKDKNTAGFMVAEPIGSKAMTEKMGQKLFNTGELWKNHPCCVLVMRESFIQAHEDATFEFIDLLVQSGKMMAEDPQMASHIAVPFLDPDHLIGLTSDMIYSALTPPYAIRTDDLFPQLTDLNKIQRYMKNEIGIGTIIDLEKFIDDRFARQAYGDSNPVTSSELPDLKIIIPQISQRLISNQSHQ